MTLDAEAMKAKIAEMKGKAKRKLGAGSGLEPPSKV